MTSLPLVMVRGSVLVAPDQALPRLIVSATLSRNAKWAKLSLTSPASVAPTTLTSTYACDCARAARAKGLSRYQWQRNTRNTKGSLPVPKAFRKLLCPKP